MHRALARASCAGGTLTSSCIGSAIGAVAGATKYGMGADRTAQREKFRHGSGLES